MALLLQVTDAGRLTDSRGDPVDFRNALVIMSTNAGMERFHRTGSVIGFASSSTPSAADYDENAIGNAFPAEFRNRLDGEILFNPIARDMMPDIVVASIATLRSDIIAQNLSFEVDDTAVAWLAVRGFDPVFGARPLQRLIQKEILDRLATTHMDNPDAHVALRFFEKDGTLAMEAGSPEN
jgi:ATP-dependent Clp protease ATP-binding subunit ClpA